jgi:hypothetical protein
MIRLSGSPLPAPLLFTAVVGTAALVGFYLAVHKTFVGQLVEHGHGTHVPSPLPRGIALNGGQVGPSTVTPVTAPVEGIDGLGAINLAVELLAIAAYRALCRVRGGDAVPSRCSFWHASHGRSW